MSPGRGSSRAAALGSILIASACFVSIPLACTDFDGLEPEPSSTSSGGEGGTGGAEPTGPASYLPLLDAVHVCSLVFRCPEIGTSIFLSTGIPVIEVAPLGVIEASNFSACVDWLTAPLGPNGEEPGARLGFELSRSMVVCMAATQTCADAAGCAPLEVMTMTDPRCEGQTGQRCEGDDLVDCGTSVVSHCGADGFAPGSVCKEGVAGGFGCSVGNCSSFELTCDDSYVFLCNAAGLRVGFECIGFGLGCEEQKGCVHATGVALCDTLGTQRCSTDEARAYACSGVYDAEVDCAAMDRRCVQEAGDNGTARCARDSETCSPYDPGVNVCLDGDTLSACIQGEPVEIDCGALQLGCVPPSGSGTVSGHCGQG